MPVEESALARPVPTLHVPQPAEFDISSNDLEEAWENFMSEFNLYAEVTNLKEQSEKTRISHLLLCMGVEAKKWYPRILCCCAGVEGNTKK